LFAPLIFSWSRHGRASVYQKHLRLFRPPWPFWSTFRRFFFSSMLPFEMFESARLFWFCFFLTSTPPTTPSTRPHFLPSDASSSLFSSLKCVVSFFVLDWSEDESCYWAPLHFLVVGIIKLVPKSPKRASIAGRFLHSPQKVPPLASASLALHFQAFDLWCLFSPSDRSFPESIRQLSMRR